MVKFENPIGAVTVTDNFITDLAGYITTSCYGVVDMATGSIRDRMLGVVKKNVPSKGVRIRGENSNLEIDLHIVVTYGCNITAIVKSIVHKVSYTLEGMIGVKIKDINVFVDNMKA